MEKIYKKNLEKIIEKKVNFLIIDISFSRFKIMKSESSKCYLIAENKKKSV